MYGTRARATHNTMLQDEGHLVSIQKMAEPFKYKLAHDVLDANGATTGEGVSETFEITEQCRLSPEWTRVTIHYFMDHFGCETVNSVGLDQIDEAAMNVKSYLK
jgi:hypothetical protein